MRARERKPGLRVSVGGGRGLVERKIKPTQGSSYVTVHITDVPTDTQCGLWAEACGEPVWLEIGFFFLSFFFFWTVCACIVICRPAYCVNADLSAGVIFKSTHSESWSCIEVMKIAV